MLDAEVLEMTPFNWRALLITSALALAAMCCGSCARQMDRVTYRPDGTVTVHHAVRCIGTDIGKVHSTFAWAPQSLHASTSAADVNQSKSFQDSMDALKIAVQALDDALKAYIATLTPGIAGIPFSPTLKLKPSL